MSDKHIVLVHGRDIKPAASAMATLAKKAVVRGLERAGNGAAANKVTQGQVKFSSVYFGDISNRIESEDDPKVKALLSAQNDAGYPFKPCFPIAPLEEGYARTDKIPNFSKAAYRKVLDEAEDWRLLDEAAAAASLFGALLTFGFLNDFLVSAIKSDLTAYLTSQVVGSEIRTRLHDVLDKALTDGDDICLVTHSLGCMVAYDVMWKYSFYGEYAQMRAPAKPIKLWITMGCPLGEIGVQRNLLDAMALTSEKFPRNQFVDWVNVSAEDDYISHASNMRSSFAKMASKGYCKSIRDKKIYNCWNYTKLPTGTVVSNPHDLYGYLMNQDTAKFIGDWI